MRIKRNCLRTYYLRKRKIVKDQECVLTESFASAHPVKMRVWPAGGRVQAEQYGERLSYIYNCQIDGKYTIKETSDGIAYQFEGCELCEKDGICLFVSAESSPDYRIISIKPYEPLYMEVEKIVYQRS